jgi:hypothetical protein
MKTFRTLFLVLALMLVAGSTFAANELFRSVASGNWNLTSSWEMSTNGGGAWFAATATPHDTSGAITIRVPNNVTVTANVTANQLTIDSGAVLTINSGVVLTIIAGSGNDLTLLKGSVLNGPGTVRTQGTIEINPRAGSAFNAQLNVNTGTTVANDQTSPYQGNLFGNVTIDAGATLNGGSVSGFSIVLFGNVTNNGTLTTGSAGANVFMKGPSLTNSGTINPGKFYLDSITTISGSGAYSSPNTYVRGNSTMLSNMTGSPSSQFFVTSTGTLNPNGFTFTFTSGTLSLESGATISAPGTVRTQNIIGIGITGGAFFNADLKINTGTATLNNASSVSNNVYGNLTIDAGATLNGGNTSGRNSTYYGTVTNNGTLTATSTGGRNHVKGSSLTNNGVITGYNFYLDSTTSISGNGIYTVDDIYITTNGNVSLLNDITVNPVSIFQIETGGTLNPNGRIFTIASGTLVLGIGATISDSGLIRTQNGPGFSIAGGAFFNADLNINTGTTISFNGTGNPAVYYGDVTIDAGATFNGGNISGTKSYYYGSVTNNGTLTATSTGGMNRIKGNTLINNGVITGNNFWFDTTTAFSGTGSFTTNANFNTNANVTLLSGHQMLSLSINTGASFNITGRVLKLSGGSPISQSGTFTQTNAMVEYNGTTAQTVSVTNITYNKLKLNNSAGASLAGNLTVNDSLIIQSGILNISTRILTLSPTSVLKESAGNLITGTTGYITTTRTISAPSALNVGGLGAVITTAANLGSTEVRRGHAVQNGLNGGTSIKRYFDITPANNSGLNATLVYLYDETELNGKPEAGLKLFTSSNSGVNWILSGGTPNAANNSVTVTGLNSFSRWSADSSSVSLVINMAIEGFYNPATNRLNMKDTVRAYLRNISSPYAIVDSAKSVLDSLNFNALFRFSSAPNGTYYIQVKHRNSIETWSKAGGEAYNTVNTLNYYFINSAASAFGNNQVQVDASPLRFAIYSGDVTQDGTVDATDLSLIDNDASNFLSGYLATDLNGDRFTDGSDYLIADNNAYNFISAVKP